jgi:hypothetical protein
VSITNRTLQTRPAPATLRRLQLSQAVSRLLRATVLILVGLMVTIGSATSDAYLHRGANEDSSIVYRQPTGRGLATNVDLSGLSDTGLQSAVNFLASAGYQFVRQEFAWAQFEPTPGSFDWSEYRRIVDSLAAVNIEVVAVLVQSPAWARTPDSISFADAPPFSSELYRTMCAALREAFPELRYFQVGQNLDDPAFWGGSDLRAQQYRQLLEAAADGLNIGVTDSVLIAGEVGLNAEIRRTGGDIAALRRLMGDPSVRTLVRAISVVVDGGDSSPYDRRTQVGRSNLSRVVLVREAIDDVGAINMPIWFTHFGWSGRGDDPVSLADQSRFVESGIRRARSEWPWVGLIFNWTFGPIEGEPKSAAMALLVNGRATPLLDAVTEFARSTLGSSITNGFVPPNSPACEYTGNWQDQHIASGAYKTVRDPNALVTCRFWGTGVAVLFRFSPDAATARYAIDEPDLQQADENSSGSVFLTYRLADAFEDSVELASGLDEGAHTVTIGLEGQGEVVIGGYLVSRERPMIWPIAVLVAAGLVGLFLGLRSLAFLAAERAGVIQPRQATAERTPLPALPEFRPAPRSQRR